MVGWERNGEDNFELDLALRWRFGDIHSYSDRVGMGWDGIEATGTSLDL